MKKVFFNRGVRITIEDFQCKICGSPGKKFGFIWDNGTKYALFLKCKCRENK